jgi:hypothetical protein
MSVAIPYLHYPLYTFMLWTRKTSLSTLSHKIYNFTATKNKNLSQWSAIFKKTLLLLRCLTLIKIECSYTSTTPYTPSCCERGKLRFQLFPIIFTNSQQRTKTCLYEVQYLNKHYCCHVWLWWKLSVAIPPLPPIHLHVVNAENFTSLSFPYNLQIRSNKERKLVSLKHNI